MITIETGYNKVLPCPINDIKSIAYNGCEYAVIMDHCDTITILDEVLCPIGKQRVYRSYASISYSATQCCYFAISHTNDHKIYVLDLNFEEIHFLEISCNVGIKPCAISANPTKPEVLLLYHNEIVCLNLNTGKIVYREGICEKQKCAQILALIDGYIFAYERDGKTFLEVHCETCDKGKVHCLPHHLCLQAMLLLGICEKEDGIGYDVQLILRDENTCDQIVTLLHIFCQKEKPGPHPKPCDFTCEGGKNEIIHSIALEEAGIAHILNAEGEKLQKAVASDITIEELIKVNESVRKTITQIAILEGQLYSKLESLHEICEDEKKEEK